MGVDFATRGARLRECVRALRSLWTDSEPELHGRLHFGDKLEPAGAEAVVIVTAICRPG